MRHQGAHENVRLLRPRCEVALDVSAIPKSGSNSRKFGTPAAHADISLTNALAELQVPPRAALKHLRAFGEGLDVYTVLHIVCVTRYVAHGFSWALINSTRFDSSFAGVV